MQYGVHHLNHAGALNNNNHHYDYMYSDGGSEEEVDSDG